VAYVLVLTVLPAGCSGLASDGGNAEPGPGGAGTDESGAGDGSANGPAASVTPAPVPAVENVTAGSDRRLAPGLTEAGVADPDALLRAHRGVLDGAPYTVRMVVRATYPNGTIYYRSAATTRVAAEEDRYYYIGRFALANAESSALSRYESWSNGRAILTASVTNANASGDGSTSENGSGDRRNTTLDNEATYERVPAAYERNAGLYGSPQYGERIYGQVSRAETVVRDRTDAAGRTYYVVSITGVRDRSVPAGGRFSNVRNPSGRLLVGPRGFVREYRFAFDGTTPNGRTVRVVESIEYSSVGRTTVPRPPWYERAIAATNDSETGSSETNASRNRDMARSRMSIQR
jgi:hypothetical protein